MSTPPKVETEGGTRPSSGVTTPDVRAKHPMCVPDTVDHPASVPVQPNNAHCPCFRGPDAYRRHFGERYIVAVPMFPPRPKSKQKEVHARVSVSPHPMCVPDTVDHPASVPVQPNNAHCPCFRGSGAYRRHRGERYIDVVPMFPPRPKSKKKKVHAQVPVVLCHHTRCECQTLDVSAKHPL